MNRLVLIAAVTAALIGAITASICTLVAVGFAAEPEVVQAAPQQKPGMQVAVVNLEDVCRQSPQFAKSKMSWEAARRELTQTNRKDLQRYEELKARLEREKLVGDADSVLDLRVELQSYEEKLQAARDEQKEYLASLLSEYQRRVLSEVLTHVKRYARQTGFDLVLQTYSIAESDSDFFASESFVQTLMSQTVLDAPGADDLSNAHVTDITDKMISFMQNGGVPEPQPENEKEK